MQPRGGRDGLCRGVGDPFRAPHLVDGCAERQQQDLVRSAAGCRSGSVTRDARPGHHRRSRPRRAGISRRAGGCRDRGGTRRRGGEARGTRTADDRRRGAVRRSRVRRRALALGRAATDDGTSAVQAAPRGHDRGRRQLWVLGGAAGRGVGPLRRRCLGGPVARCVGPPRLVRRLPRSRRSRRPDEQHRAAGRPRDAPPHRERHAPRSLGRGAGHDVRAGRRSVPRGRRGPVHRLDLRSGDVRGHR